METFERRITVVDIVMIALALVSLGLLVYEDVYDPSPETRQRIVWIDLGIVGVFALEFLVRLTQAKQKARYVKSHWYDLIGLVPVAHPLFRAFRLARLVRLFVVGSRLLRATDRSLGEAFVQRQLSRYRGIVVEELTNPILLAAITMTERAVLQGNYGTAVARGLGKHRDDIAARILEQMRGDKAVGLALKTPVVGPAIEGLPGRVLDGVIDTLGQKEMDGAIRGVIQEILEDLKREVGRRDWLEKEKPAAA